MGKNLDNGTFCGDKRLGRFLIMLVVVAAWLADPRGKYKVER